MWADRQTLPPHCTFISCTSCRQCIAMYGFTPNNLPLTAGGLGGAMPTPNWRSLSFCNLRLVLADSSRSLRIFASSLSLDANSCFRPRIVASRCASSRTASALAGGAPTAITIGGAAARLLGFVSCTGCSSAFFSAACLHMCAWCFAEANWSSKSDVCFSYLNYR